jgi:hypothetical protein
MQLVDHIVYTFVTQLVCVYLRCRDFLPKCFSIEALRLQETLFLNRDLCATAAITLVQANMFFFYGEIMFLRHRFKFFT